MTTDNDQLLRDLAASMLHAVRVIGEHLAGPPAPDAEVRSWPICTPENDFTGGVWCADPDCPLDCEASEIGDFREGTFTLDEMHAAIGEHIARRRERENEGNTDA